MGAKVEKWMLYMQVYKIALEWNEQAADTKLDGEESNAMKPSHLAVNAIAADCNALDIFCAALTLKVKQFLRYCIECPVNQHA